MSKHKSSGDKDSGSGILASDGDAELPGDAHAGSPQPAPQAAQGEEETLEIDVAAAAEDVADHESPAAGETHETGEAGEAKAQDAAAAVADAEPEASADTGSEPPPAPRRGFPWFGLFNFLLILALAGAAGYYWWLEQQVKRESEATIAALRAELETRATRASLDARVGPLRADIDRLGRELGNLETGQESLRVASEKLFELFGRDKNDWQLAEVEYLMRVAQHKLILQDDFEGAAVTLQAASDKIALTGDPGLLSVRVMISDEIADLKTRRRPDLVGTTLILAQLARQLRVLEPGFELRVNQTAPVPSTGEPSQGWLERLRAFVDSLVEVRIESTDPTELEADAVNVAETLEDNLKLARWSVLERDGRQYHELIDQSLRLFREFYDLDNAANRDFFSQLQELQKMQLRPEKPDITGSLRELQRILAQRENAPESGPAEGGDG